MGSGRKYPIGTRVRFRETEAGTESGTADGRPAAKVISIIDKDKNTIIGEDTIAIGDKANLRRVGEYVLRTFNKGLTRNCSMYLSEMPTKENNGYYRFGQNADVKAGEGVTVKKDRVRFDSLRLPYCATGHSSQGVRRSREGTVSTTSGRLT